MTGYGLQIFEKLNDITLFQGSELYKDRLHLDRAAAVYDADNRSISLTMPPMAEFMEALFGGQFVEADAKIRSALEHSDARSIYFEDDMGFVTQIEVYPEGYVLMRKHEDLFIVQLEPEICLKITDMNLEQQKCE